MHAVGSDDVVFVLRQLVVVEYKHRSLVEVFSVFAICVCYAFKLVDARPVC